MRAKTAKRQFNAEKISAVVAITTTAAILFCNPWTLFWYPPVALTIGLLTFAVTNALLTCTEVCS